MSKPPFISHYLVLSDLIDKKDVRTVSAKDVYLTSRIENIKSNLVKRGLMFEDERTQTTYSNYKPYALIQDEANMKLAKELLEGYATPKVLSFIDGLQKRSV